MSQRRFRSVTSVVVLLISSLCASLCVWITTAQNTGGGPAQQGRPLTPAGRLVVDLTTRRPVVGALPVDFVRSPDRSGPEGQGRYLIAVNSGFGVQFNSVTNRAQQSLAVIDLNARPEPAVVQNVYFPSPQSANVGLAFSPAPDSTGSHTLYVSGGFENKVWMFRFAPGARVPITPASPGPNTRVEAPSIDVSAFTFFAPTPNYNENVAPVYPAGLAMSPDGDTIYVANNLGDSLGIVGNIRGERRLTRVDLHGENKRQNVYPYGVVALPTSEGSTVAKLYVSCWNDAAVAVVDPRQLQGPVTRIPVGRHPTAMVLNNRRTRLYVVNSNADTVSVIDTATDREVERINVRLSERALVGSSPESLALGRDETTLYVANSHSNAIAVVGLGPRARGTGSDGDERSRVRGFIPAGQYPSAVAVAGGMIFVGNGKGTGAENSSLIVNDSGRAPNIANDRFPAAGSARGGQYILSLISGNISAIREPDDRELAAYTQQVMRNNGLLGPQRATLFRGPSPIKHVIYIIKENRTYDQVFGDLETAGDGSKADGDASLAIFGSGEAARLPGGSPQIISPNHRALALRFGLLDRFFVNAEASPDGHNWSTAAFSNDYVDKAYRWDYSGRGRTYDYEGFNRLPSYEPPASLPPVFNLPVTAEDVAGYMQLFVPYLHGGRDVAEPETLYLWDAVGRARLTHRNYGEFVGTISEKDVEEINTRRRKGYPDISRTVKAFATKKSLEGHHSAAFRNYDLSTPDSMTVESYRAATESGSAIEPTIRWDHPDPRFRGSSRLSEWLNEFHGWVADLEAGRGDRMPNFSMLRFSNNHTAGLRVGMPTPQFFVAENDYALGRLVEAVSNSPYWKDTAIFVVEDDAQDGPDHVDAHRSPALVISAYNRPGALVHEFHNTVSLIRTMELLLGVAPMNQLDATAVPIDIFRAEPDLRPYKAVLPNVALNNLMNQPARDSTTAHWIRLTEQQNLTHADMANPRVLNQIIWFSVRGGIASMPEIARLPAFDAMREGLIDDDDEDEDREKDPREPANRLKSHLARK